MNEQSEKRGKINPDTFFPLVEAAELIGIPLITLDYFSGVGAIPYKLVNGEKFFRYESLLIFYNGGEYKLKAGEKFSKDWK